MPDISDVFKQYSLLSPQEQKKLYSMISYQISTDNDFEAYMVRYERSHTI